MLVYEEVRAAFETVTTKVTRGRRLRSPDGKEAPDFQGIVADVFFLPDCRRGCCELIPCNLQTQI